MGKKILAAGSGLSLFGVLISMIALALPLHKARFSVIGFLTMFELETYAAVVDFDSGLKKNLCKQGLKKMCSDGKSMWLQDVQSTLCTSSAKQIFTDACTGFEWAYTIGIALIICVVTNAIMQGTGAFLVSQYFSHSPKKQFREASLILDIIGLLMYSIVVVVYYPTAIEHLNIMRLRGNIVEKNGGVGSSWGYVLMWISVIVQGISVVLQAYGANTEEVRAADLREERKFMQEMAMFEQAGGAVASGQNPGRGSQAPPAHFQQSQWPAYGQSAGRPPMQPMQPPMQVISMGGPPVMQQSVGGFGGRPVQMQQGRGPPYF